MSLWVILKVLALHRKGSHLHKIRFARVDGARRARKVYFWNEYKEMIGLKVMITQKQLGVECVNSVIQRQVWVDK